MKVQEDLLKGLQDTRFMIGDGLYLAKGSDQLL
jgi:hypothetical protein